MRRGSSRWAPRRAPEYGSIRYRGSGGRWPGARPRHRHGLWDGGRIGALAFLHGDGIAGGDDVVLQHLSAPSVRGGLPHGTRGEAAGREIIRSDGVAGRGARVGSASRKVLITAVRRSCGQHTAQIRLGGECGECRTRVVGVGETVGERVTDIYLVAEGVGTRHRDGEHVSIIAGRTRGGYPCGQYHQHGSGRHQRAKTAQQRWLGRTNMCVPLLCNAGSRLWAPTAVPPMGRHGFLTIERYLYSILLFNLH